MRFQVLFIHNEILIIYCLVYIKIMSTQVYKGPKGGYFILINGKKRYLKVEEAKALMGKSLTKKKPLKSKAKTKGKYLRQELAYWSQMKPKRGAEREALIKKCGDACFLIPQERKYPICSKDKKCQPSCNSILSAMNRARMVSGKATKYGNKSLAEKHHKIFEEAKLLKGKYKC
jgi:hypothetical protein